MLKKSCKKSTLFVYILLLSPLVSQNIQDLQRLQEQYEQQSRVRDIQGLEAGSSNNLDIESSQPREVLVSPFFDAFLDSSSNNTYYFGYDFFSKRDSVIFWENLPTPNDYILGPGDEIVISLWGQTKIRENYIISKEGDIYDDKVGLINLGGKSIESAAKYLINQYKEVYSTLGGNPPKTFFDLSLGRLGSINVNFVGECIYPGVYALHPYSNLITGLIHSGGVDTTGSLRKIKIKRASGKIINVDLYDYFLKGNLPKNIQLKDQDIVLVPVRESTVTINESVYRPGIYEGLKNETIFDLISYAGGNRPNSSNMIGIKRIVSSKINVDVNKKFENYYISLDASKTKNISDGDLITVKAISENVNEVEVVGRVKKPGKYYFFPGMRILDLIDLSGGMNDLTYALSMYDDAQLVRREPDRRYEKVIPIKLSELDKADNKKNILLKNLDRLVIHKNSDFFSQENVKIFGEVKIPGSYPLISDGETLNSIISRSGGMTQKALINGVEIYRDSRYFNSGMLFSDQNSNDSENFNIDDGTLNATDEKVNKIRVAWQNLNIKLMPGDSVIVKESTGSVNVSGEVYNPGLIEYQKNKSMNYYINSSGGLTPIGNKKDIIVIYANGVIVPKRWYGTPRIEDGSTIIVNPKPIQEPFNITQFATNWTSIISSVVTAVVLAKQL